MSFELTDQVAQALAAVLALFGGRKDLLTEGVDILNDPLAAVVGQRHRINLRRAITLVEPGGFLGLISGAAEARPDKHQITLFRREQGGIPVHDVKRAVVANQEIAVVKVGMTENNRLGAGLKLVG